MTAHPKVRMTLSMTPEQADELGNVHALNGGHTQNNLLCTLVQIGIETAMQSRYDGNVSAALADVAKKSAK